MEKNSKILIIVPHQDDEINVAGGLIYSLKNKENVYIVYVTNGDFIFDAKYRYKEAINSLKKLGINEKNIIFLGYSDQAYDQQTHMYNSDNDWESKKGYSNTYGALGIQDWNYKKYGKHCKFNKNNVIKNIKEVILEILPDIIISVDLDFHPDHIMTSLCFEKAMGEILNNNKQYYPEVLKTFAYENSYLGENDFFDFEENYSKYNMDKEGNSLSNPYYNKKDEVRVPILKKCYSLNLFKNPTFKAIKAHISQVLVKRATSIINKDYVYWKRRTDNLLNDAIIKTSSSNPEYLHDFLISDTKDVLNGNIKQILYSERIWIPEEKDKEKIIYIDFNEEKMIENIVLYNGRINNEFVKEILIDVDGKKEKVVLEPKMTNEILLKTKCKKISIQILDSICKNGFSEIEIFDKEKKVLLYDYIEKNYKKDNLSSKYINNIKVCMDKLYINILVFVTKVKRKLFVK